MLGYKVEVERRRRMLASSGQQGRRPRAMGGQRRRLGVGERFIFRLFFSQQRTHLTLELGPGRRRDRHSSH